MPTIWLVLISTKAYSINSLRQVYTIVTNRAKPTRRVMPAGGEEQGLEKRRSREREVAPSPRSSRSSMAQEELCSLIRMMIWILSLRETRSAIRIMAQLAFARKTIFTKTRTATTKSRKTTWSASPSASS